MPKQTFLHSLPILLMVLLVGLLGFFWFQSRSIEQVYLERVRQELRIRTRLLIPACREAIADGDLRQLDAFCREQDRRIDTRLTILSADGKVLADTQENAERMDNHRDRPEVAAAIAAFAAGETFHDALRYSATLGRRQLYCSTPVRVGDRTYILRTALSIQDVDRVLAQARRDIAAAVLLTLLLAAGLNVLIILLVSRPVRNLRNASRLIAAGSLDTRLPIPRRGAIRELALSLSEMAEQLKARIAQISREKSERDAIFTALAEGVIVTDLNGSIIDLNLAAGRILELKSPRPIGISVLGLLRDREFETFFDRIRSGGAPEELELTSAMPSGDRSLRIRAARMEWGSDHASGILLVLYDLTRLRRLENYRRDFVANVSHEIKTPITVIRGAVETLQDGAIDDPEAAKRFLQIVAMHSDRLTSLVEDILSLSDLECRTADPEREFETVSAAAVAQTAMELCRHRAEAKQIALHLEDRSADALLRGDRQLLEQALVNLIDNAIKYSGTTRPIEIVLEREADRLAIRVTDHGVGIAAEHLPRLFERFYRVDRARSRKAGGTGLGLAIVKHIAQLHGGTAEADSQPGCGSTFTLRLPLA